MFLMPMVCKFCANLAVFSKASMMSFCRAMVFSTDREKPLVLILVYAFCKSTCRAARVSVLKAWVRMSRVCFSMAH